MIEQGLLAAILAIAAGGAAWDIAKRRIPNWLCALLALVCALYSFQVFGIVGLGWAALHSVIALVIGMGLFAIGAIGGGDAKFYAAGALALQLNQALAMFAVTAFSGLVVLIVMVLGRRFVARSGYAPAELRRMQLPYGVAIALGLAITLLRF
ncbi:prepilin peptidase [Altererythrobacter sp. MF3-039]|uniref:A24 family peptidase n=1 Tax=Altererythrobacter sp. MF3-039 TaxID=3252901 RepID=UPI00390C5EE6